ncbi:MAG: hypothetical protein ACK50M_13260, partial [Cyclobacteriaceae bacterium]
PPTCPASHLNSAPHYLFEVNQFYFAIQQNVIRNRKIPNQKTLAHERHKTGWCERTAEVLPGLRTDKHPFGKPIIVHSKSSS